MHYNKYNNLADYVIYTLKYIRPLFNKIVFISNSILHDKQILELTGLYETLIVRENKGFDFGAWKDALLQEGWGNLKSYDNITLMNDTCFGPLYNIEVIYNGMAKKNVDFWGLTDQMSTATGMPGTDGPVPEHIQSYFMCFSKKIIVHSVFQKFWNNVLYEESVDDVIKKYETQLTVLLKSNGFCCEAFYKATGIINLSIFCPDLCIINYVPFVKVKSFLYFQNTELIMQLLQKETNYPVSLIADYFFDIYGPAAPLSITNRYFTPNSFSCGNISDDLAKVAVHLHIEDLTNIEIFLAILDKCELNFDLLITTDQDEIKVKVIQCLQNHITGNNLVKVILLKKQNKSFDFLPWVSMAPEYRRYDIVGYFYLKKLPAQCMDSAIHYYQELCDLLLIPVNAIINFFLFKEKVGIIIPEISNLYAPFVPDNLNWEKTKILMNDLWKEMKCQKEIDFQDASVRIFPYIFAFWFRPSVFEKISTLEKIDDTLLSFFIDSNICQSINLLFVYLAWSEGFDFRISKYNAPKQEHYDFYSKLNNHIKKLNNDIKKLNNEIDELKMSKNYLIGRIVLFFPRFIKKHLKNLWISVLILHK